MQKLYRLQKVHQQKQHILFYTACCDALPATPQIAFKITLEIISSWHFFRFQLWLLVTKLALKLLNTLFLSNTITLTRTIFLAIRKLKLVTHWWHIQVLFIDPVFSCWCPRYQLLVIEPQFNFPLCTLQRIAPMAYVSAQRTAVNQLWCQRVLPSQFLCRFNILNSSKVAVQTLTNLFLN